MNTRTLGIASLLIAAATATASATIVQIDINGSVDFGGVNQGIWSDASSGDAVTMSFQVDSDVFVNGSFPTRGYNIIESSFTLTVDGNTGGMANPNPNTNTYFVIRDNDPAVDGFHIGSHPDGAEDGVATDQAGGFSPFTALFKATYGGDTLSSLDILDAQGTYTFAGLTVFNWGLEDGPFQPMGFIFDSFTIAAVPAPSVLALLAPCSMMMTRRRRA